MTAATSLALVQPSVHAPSERPTYHDSANARLRGGPQQGRARPAFHEYQDEQTLRRSDRRTEGFSGRRAADRPNRDYQPASERHRTRTNTGNFGGFGTYSSPFLTQFIAQQMMPQDERKATGFAEEAAAAYQATDQRTADAEIQFLPLTLQT